MTIQALGELSIGALLPIGVEAAAQIDVGLGVAIPQLEADLAQLGNVNASLTAQVALPQDPTEALAAALALFTTGQLARSLLSGLQEIGVSLNADLAVNTALLEALARALQTLKDGLSFSADLKASLARPGIYPYAYAGPVEDLGAEVSGATSGGVGGGSPSAPVHALVLVVPDPAAWLALSALVRTG